MSTSSRLQEKKRRSRRISLHNQDKEGAARTRPFSFGEIMIRRNNKKLCDNAIEEVVDLGNIPRESIVENVSDRFEPERDYRDLKDLSPVVENPVSEEPEKASSRKKETYNSKSARTEDNFAKEKVRGRESESLKDKPNKDTRSEAKGGKTDKLGRRQIDEHSYDKFRNESAKKHSRDPTGKERHVDQSRRKSERESKRKYQNGNDEKSRDRYAAKKHDPGKHHLLEIPERKERKEFPKSRFEKSRLKRGRSRSRDREDRHRIRSRDHEDRYRVRSLSPRADKYRSHNLGMRSELSTDLLKDKSERQHSDIDRSKVSSNGSSSHYPRHGGPMNRLGGYSPRKRRTESAIKTPSPPDRSPEKKSARWDHPPTATDKINKEKGEAVVEFLTPEDALAALSFDGSDLSGSILKIRRPRDFVEVDTGDTEKSVVAVKTVSDVVKDSCNKIFIGGISKAVSSKMLMEIIAVFGPLKAYHFEVNEELNEPCAFLEYVDQSVTLKACAGLNGMKLGGRVLTAVQAIHGASPVENNGNVSLYEIPEHAKPLLKQPSQVLKLRNVFNLEHFSPLSETEMEEVLEDVRSECTRFGTVKSVKIVKHSNNDIIDKGVFEAVNDAESGGYQKSLDSEHKEPKTDTAEELDNQSRETSGVEFLSNTKKLEEDEATEVKCSNYDKPADDFTEGKSCQMGQSGENIGSEGGEKLSNRVPEELPNQLNSMKDASESYDDKVTEAITTKDVSLENKLIAEEELTPEEADDEKQETIAGKDGNVGTELDSIEKSEIKEQDHGNERDYDNGSIFEPGCVFVEFGRTEASLMAAHCLHGRVFDDRIVTVEYISLDHYRAQFPN